MKNKKIRGTENSLSKTQQAKKQKRKKENNKKTKKQLVLLHVFLRKWIGVWYRLTHHFLSDKTTCLLGFIHNVKIQSASALRGATHVLIFLF